MHVSKTIDIGIVSYWNFHLFLVSILLVTIGGAYAASHSHDSIGSISSFSTSVDARHNKTSDTIQYEVSCSRSEMKVIINLNDMNDMNGINGINDTQESVIYLEKLKGYPICHPEVVNGRAIFRLPLDDSFYTCGTTKILNKLTRTKVFYHRIIIEDADNSRETIFVKCVVPNDFSQLPFRSKRQTNNGDAGVIIEPDLPENFMEAEELDFTGNITAQAPYPYLNLKVRQNGVFVDTALNVQPGTPLEMIIFLDERSRDVYGLLVSFLKVTDNTSRQQEEVIILNGCSIDPYIFGNFETLDGGDTLSAKFRAFKFPESNYVLFVGTVNVCLNECKGVPCGNGQFGYGRKKRSIPAEIPPDPNKVFEVEMTAFLKVDFNGEHSASKKASIERSFEDDVRVSIEVNQSNTNQLPYVQNGTGTTLRFDCLVLIIYGYLTMVFSRTY